MKLAVLEDRVVIVLEDGVVDVFEASGGSFGPAAESLFPQWTAFRSWADPLDFVAFLKPLPATPRYGAPSPLPRQAFGIGVNYRDHAAEAGMAAPTDPLVFAKFVSCIAGPSDRLSLTVPTVDWEAELVVVVGQRAQRISKEQAWSHVAGLTIGQDFSDRMLQMAGPAPQFSLGKSRPGFGAIGPFLVTPDALANRDDLEIRCTVNAEQMQSSRTRFLIHDVSAVVSYLSSVVTLFPGDVIFTGTPAGVGYTRKPPRYLAPGDTVVTRIEGLGELRTTTIGAQ